MSVGAAIRQGVRLTRRARSAVWILFLINLGLAALAALPIYQGIESFTGYSLTGQDLARGFPVEWLTDFAINSPFSLNRYARLIGLVGLLALPINAALAGGVLARFREPEQAPSLGDFFRGTVRYAWRLIRLMVIGLIAYWIIFLVFNRGLRGVVDKWTRDWQDERGILALHLGVLVLVLLGLALVNLVMDYARLKLTIEDGPSAAEAFLASLGFCLGRLRRAFLVYAFPSLCGIALLGIYRVVVPWQAINSSLGGLSKPHFQGPLTLALLFIVQQAVIFGRYWFRVATWASEWSFYADTR